MLILFSMFLLDSNQGKVKYSPLYGRGSKVRILVGRHFQSVQKNVVGHILLEIGDLTKSAFF